MIGIFYLLEANQGKIVENEGLEALIPLLRSSNLDTVTAAVAALRNLSIKRGNEVKREGERG